MLLEATGMKFGSRREIRRFPTCISARMEAYQPPVNCFPSPYRSVGRDRWHGHKIEPGKAMDKQPHVNLFFRNFNLLDCNHRKWCKIWIGTLKMLGVAELPGSHLVNCGDWRLAG